MDDRGRRRAPNGREHLLGIAHVSLEGSRLLAELRLQVRADEAGRPGDENGA